MSAANGETLVIVINRLLLRLDARGVSANEIVACIKPLIAESEAKALSSLAMVTAESADRNISLRLERDQLRTELALLREWQREVIQNANAHHAERKEAIARAERAEAELAAERARLDSGQILITVAGERVWHCGVDLRAAIDAAMKEGAK